MPWLPWIRLRQTGRHEGELQFTTSLCKPCWDCYLQFNCTFMYLQVPSLITVDLACVFLNQQLPSVPPCPVLPPLPSLLLLIPAVAVQRCPKGSLMPGTRTHNIMLALPEARPGQSLLLFVTLPSNRPIFFPLNRKFIHLKVFLNCTGYF